MNIFFDVDDTLIAFDGSLRPHVYEVFQKLLDDGHDIYIWSGVGLRWEIIERHKLRPYIQDCFVKPTANYRKGLEILGIPVHPRLLRRRPPGADQSSRWGGRQALLLGRR